MGLGIAFHGVLLQWIIDVASLVSSSNGHESLARARGGASASGMDVHGIRERGVARELF